MVLLIGILTTVAKSHPKLKNIDKDFNISLDSLSSRYQLKVGLVTVSIYSDLRITQITYVNKKGKLIYKTIKTVILPTKQGIIKGH